jgi:AraC family transcriptional regulator of adaptative response/methylated-DNA-[protein]-cysteine methyltransferase
MKADEWLHLRLARTTLGWVAMVADTQGILWVTLASSRPEAVKQARDRFEATALKEKEASPQVGQWLAAVVGAIERPTRSWKAPLRLEGTEFQRSVWQALQKIPAGTIVSYGELARRIGRPRAFRAVGRACGANPVPFLVPCHRVVAGSGGLGGFGLGLAVKRSLLEREGVL